MKATCSWILVIITLSAGVPCVAQEILDCTFEAAQGRVPPGAIPSVMPFSGPESSAPAGFDTCAAHACGMGLILNVASPDGWGMGTYQVVLETEWGTTTCTHTFSPTTWTPPDHCSQPSHPEVGISLDCIGPQPPRIGPILFLATPQQVSLRIEHDGVVLFEESLSPEYTILREDGYTCPSQCSSATERVSAH